MAACKSLRHIFENTIVPENSSSPSSASSLIDSLSPWNHIKALKPPLDHSFTEIFGELHFKENHSNPTSSFFPPLRSTSVASAFPIDLVSEKSDIDKQQDEKSGGALTSFPTNDGYSRPYHRKSDSFSSLNSDSLQLCTEGLGSESLGDVEDLTLEVQNTNSKLHARRHSSDSYCRKIKVNGATMFPPPIAYIGQAGKPSVSFQSYRENGRFVLKEEGWEGEEETCGVGRIEDIEEEEEGAKGEGVEEEDEFVRSYS
uniref:FAF domain-containing protein n=1 Tax=Chenopodium quinoa TaxID=63459 RepID=A0A803LD08_CHEQI